MSTLVTTADRDVLFANEHDQELAKSLVDQLSKAGMRFVAEQGGSGASVRVPAELSALLAHVIHAVAHGATVTVSTMPTELTTTAAAQLLGVSRPKLMRQINAGEIPAHMVGTHTRLHTADVLREREARKKRQLAAFAELRKLEDEDD